MKKIFLFSVLLIVFSIASISAFWPFEKSITGNVIDNTQMVDTEDCRDYDYGINTSKSGFVLLQKGRWFNKKTTTYKDTCYGASLKILDSNGKQIDTGKSQIKEYYCEEGNLKEFLADSSILGAGHCVVEKLVVEGKTISSAKWVADSPLCINSTNGVKDGYSKVYNNFCDDSNNFVTYSCNKNEIVSTSSTCSGKCNPKIGCSNFCDIDSDTDLDQDPAIFGEVVYEGNSYNDTCTESGSKVTIKQYACSSNTLLKDTSTTFTDKCDGSNFIDYSCEGNVLVQENIPCPGSCNLEKGGCYGFCNETSDTDLSQDPLVGGTVDSAGKFYNDACGKNDDGKIYVKQYFCETSLKLASNVTYCSRDQECVKDTNGLGYCRDKISTSLTVTTLEEKIAQLQSDLDSLIARVSALENN